jgi:hypothetical protein
MTAVHKADARGKVAQGDGKMAERLRQSAITLAGVGLICVAYAAVMYGLVELDFYPREESSSSWTSVPRLAVFVGYLLFIDTGLLPALLMRRMNFRSLVLYLLNGGLAALMASYCFLFSFAVCCWPVGWRWIFDMPPFSWEQSGIMELLQPTFFEKEAVLALLISLLCGLLFWWFGVRRSEHGAKVNA